jgi:hypothetical protein
MNEVVLAAVYVAYTVELQGLQVTRVVIVQDAGCSRADCLFVMDNQPVEAWVDLQYCSLYSLYYLCAELSGPLHHCWHVGFSDLL